MQFRWETELQKTDFGDVPKDWSIILLGDTTRFTIIMGQSPPSKYYNTENQGMPFIQGKTEFTDLYTKPRIHTSAITKIAPRDSVIFTVRAPVGAVNITKQEICIGRGVAAIFSKSDEKLENVFIYYLLKGQREYISQIGETGTTYSAITKEGINELQIPFPPKSERYSIARILSWLDKQIENKVMQNNTLEKIAMALFKKSFIDFKPFRNGSFVISSLDKVRQGWKSKSIGEIAELRKGVSYRGKEKYVRKIEGGYIFITLNNAIEGGGFKPSFAWIKSDRLKEHHFLREGDLIIPNTEQTKDERLLGSPGIVFFPESYKLERGVFSHHITKISPTDPKYKLFLYLFLKLTREDTATFHTGTGVLGLDIKNLCRNKIVICPPEKLVENFHFNIEVLFKKTILNCKQIIILKKIREHLLLPLILGRLRVQVG